MSQTIDFLSELEHIQRRPGMYVGDTANPRTLVRELVDNALDEFINGHADKIEIEYDPARGMYKVSDNGRGLPLYKVEEFENQVAAKLLFMKLFSGGKFNHANYKFSSGLHGVGLCCVNALSESVDIIVGQKKKTYLLRMENGEDIDEKFIREESDWSTSVTCMPSTKFFKSVRTVIDHLPLELAKTMRPEGQIIVNGQDVKPFDFIMNLPSALINNNHFTHRFKNDNIIFEVYFGWDVNDVNYFSKGTVNLVPCALGWHERIAKRAIGKALSNISEAINPDDAGYGLRIFVNLFTQEPTFTSQTKDRLSSIKDEPDAFESILIKGLEKTLKSNGELLQSVQGKIFRYKQKLAKLSDHEVIDAVVRKGNDKRRSKGVGVGIWECSTRDRSKAELYIVEGDSAAGHVRRTRNTQTQAVLPLRGKPLNAVVADDIKAILENDEMVSLINCIGAGVSPKVDLDGLRYGKVIIAADADADGAQISNLVIGALVYLIPEVVAAGHIYEVMAPLYQQGTNFYYSLDDFNSNKPFDRFKGLGSMNPNEVEKTIINIKTRRLRQVTLDDRERILHILQSPAAKKRIMVEGGVIREV